ncbi:MAG: methionyl-tRNA formyltransferase [Candidatus Jorgensenbacteria bacterium]|nr:methionyl-tRNA formyltransferase [Candidatus Jorgensenbacteria bacterium]
MISRFAFFGSPKFAEIILRKLISAGMSPAVVICNPDKPAGRKKIMTPPETKIMAQKHGIQIYQPERLSAEAFESEVGNVDFAVVAAYAKIIPADILKLPRLGVIGVHPSLLPKYRGSSPIQTAILNGDEETGVTLYKLDEKVDHGEIISSSKYPLSSTDTYETLEKKLAELGGESLVETLPKFVSGEIKPEPQVESQATFTKKFKTEDGFVEYEILERAQKDGGDIATKLDRMIRALSSEPGAWTLKRDGKPFSSTQGKRMKLLEAVLLNGKLKLKKIQIEGKKEQQMLVD